MIEDQIFYTYPEVIIRMKKKIPSTWMSFWWWLHNNQDQDAIDSITELLNESILPYPRLVKTFPITVKTQYINDMALFEAILKYYNENGE